MTMIRHGNVVYWKVADRVEIQYGLKSGKVHAWVKGKPYTIRKADYAKFASSELTAPDILVVSSLTMAFIVGWITSEIWRRL